MITTIVAAMAHDNVIGRNNRLPWNLPADLARFKKITMGKPLLMGRNTYESIGKPLPGRLNMVLSRNPAARIAGCEIVSDVDTAYAAVEGVDEIIIMGGAELYAQMLPVADKLELTLVNARIKGDAWFPKIDYANWQETLREPHLSDDNNQYDYTFVTYARIRQDK